MYNSFHDGAFVVQITENTLSIATTITSNYQHGRRGIFLNSYKVVTFTAVTLSELSMKLVGWPMWFFPVLLEISLHFPSHSALGTVLGLWQDIQWHEYNMSHTHTHTFLQCEKSASVPETKSTKTLSHNSVIIWSAQNLYNYFLQLFRFPLHNIFTSKEYDRKCQQTV